MEVGLKVTGERVLVQPYKVEEQSRGGIVLVDATKDAEARAQTHSVVIAAGDEAWKVPEMRGVKVGDTVLHARYAGDNFHVKKDGVTYRVINAKDVVGVLIGELDSQFKAARSTAETFGINQAA